MTNLLQDAEMRCTVMRLTYGVTSDQYQRAMQMLRDLQPHTPLAIIRSEMPTVTDEQIVEAVTQYGSEQMLRILTYAAAGHQISAMNEGMRVRS